MVSPVGSIPSSTLDNAGDVRPFLQSHPHFSPATIKSKTVDEAMLSDSQKVAYLQLELAAAVDCNAKVCKSLLTTWRV